MLSPTPRAILLMALGAPIFLAVAVAAPAYWVAAAGWIAAVVGLILVDAALAARLSSFEAEVQPPPVLHIGASAPADATLRFVDGPLPARIETQLETGPGLDRPPVQGLRGFENRARPHQIVLTPRRRGQSELKRLWTRWRGPLGLIQKRRRTPLGLKIPVIPNIPWVQDEAVRLYARDAEFGVKTQLERGDGSEFDALRDFTVGMDRRAIDWKHSARHRALLAKEFKTERNHHIVFAFDTGRLMSEPLRGVPKLDRAINAALLTAYVSLRAGDRAALFGFDARPTLTSPVMSGPRAFPRLQKLASTLDYSTEEANYTLALTELSSRLERRSLIVLFTDFVDSISAELMLETAKRLTKRHLLVFAAFRDEALESLIDAAPETPEDVARAVFADSLLQERELVLRKLTRLGAHILETSPEGFGAALLSRYLEIKRRELV